MPAGWKEPTRTDRAFIISGKMPRRLPLGSDCVRIIREELTQRLQELEEWADVSARTDFAEYGDTAK